MKMAMPFPKGPFWYLKVKGSRKVGDPMTWHHVSTKIKVEDKRHTPKTAIRLATILHELRERNDTASWDLTHAILRGELPLSELLARFGDGEATYTDERGRVRIKDDLTRAQEALEQQRESDLESYVTLWEKDTQYRAVYKRKLSSPRQKAQNITFIRELVKTDPDYNSLDFLQSPPRLLAAFIKFQTDRSLTTKTMIGYRAAFGALSKYLMHRKVITANVATAEHVPLDKSDEEVAFDREVIIYEFAQMQQLLALDARDVCKKADDFELFAAWQALTALALGCGADWSALARLRKSSFAWLTDEYGEVKLDADGEPVVMVDLKGTKTVFRERPVLMFKWAWKVVQPYVEALSDDEAWFIPRATQGKGKGRSPRYHALRRLHHRICKHLGIRDQAPAAEGKKLKGLRVFHRMRHSFACYAIYHRKVPIHIVKRQLGHSPRSQTLERVYAKYCESQIHRSADEFDVSDMLAKPQQSVVTGVASALVQALESRPDVMAQLVALLGQPAAPPALKLVQNE